MLAFDTPLSFDLGILLSKLFEGKLLFDFKIVVFDFIILLFDLLLDTFDLLRKLF